MKELKPSRSLRTLKDIGEHKEKKWMGYDFVLTHVLREEAIKWVKELRDENKDSKDIYGAYDNEGECYLAENVVTWIFDFFNITEEDLE